MNTAPLKVAVLGCGVVGTEVVRRLHSSAPDLAARIGAPVELAGVAVRDTRRPRGLGLDPGLWTDDPLALVKRGDIDIVVELLGGTEPARSLAVAAMEQGASVVSANKALLAEHGPLLHESAARHGVDLLYEASVAGAVPLLRPLRDSLGGDRITRITGVVNGTTNYILDRMTETGGGFAAALREAVDHGYAEADPTADVEGLDAAAKAVVLAALAFGVRVPPADVRREGITGVTAADVADARALGRVVKPVTVLERPTGRDGVLLRVHPAMVARAHPLAEVRGADNAVLVEAADAGPLLFRGAGAGGVPTAGAVLGDVVAAARRRVLGHRGAAPQTLVARSGAVPGARSRHHLRVPVTDTAAALADVAAALRDGGVRVGGAHRRRAAGREALVLLTEDTDDAALSSALAAVAALPCVSGAPRGMRLLDAEEHR
ncbi:homoserine dehydrogenase [Streptomyces andamanensis]|uniref:Homoserine dehydrogenase n=1 Tax=Streptomyces andamanensis TaxID=1565035 RepID=A0ABV8T8M2_9ACTN